MFQSGVSFNRQSGLTLGGDLVAIALFATAGASRHPEATSLFARVPEIALPFVVGWLAVGALVGTFTSDALSSSKVAMARAAVAWLGADIVAQGIRATPYPGGADPIFFIVALLLGGVLLVGWRGLAARLL